MARGRSPKLSVVSTGKIGKDKIKEKKKFEKKIRTKSDLKPPKWLDKRGKEEFERVVKEVQNTEMNLLDNLDLSDLAMHERARKGIGYLPQEASIFRKLTISENIMAILETRKDLNKQQRQQRLIELLNDFKINHIKDSLGMSVSGGERRRAEIARALAADPKFMLLDEPFAGVDPISVGDIKDIIQTLKERGIGVLITDHNVRETLAICEKAYIVSEGSVIAEGTPQEILDNEQVRKVYLGDDFVV